MAKYNFKGIKEKGASGLKLALASNPNTAWILKVPFLTNLLEISVNWAANNGLVILNVGAIIINGELDQNKLDKALDEGIEAVKNGGLTPAQEKEIDDEVIKAADRALPYTK